MQLFYEGRKVRLHKKLDIQGQRGFSVIESLEKSGLEFYTSTICFHSQQVVEDH
jgi:hypothetical protein